MHPTCTRSFASNGIEVACSALTLPNATNMQIIVLHRSPIVPLQTLTDMLSTLLDYVSTANMPTLILGDINKNSLSKRNSVTASRLNPMFEQCTCSAAGKTPPKG